MSLHPGGILVTSRRDGHGELRGGSSNATSSPERTNTTLLMGGGEGRGVRAGSGSVRFFLGFLGGMEGVEVMSGVRSAVRMTSRLTQRRAGRVPVLFPAVTRSAAPCRDAAGWELGEFGN